MCSYLSVRHARCGHDISRREVLCVIEESLPGHSLCRQWKYDLGMKQEDTLCPGCERRELQMYRHGWPEDPIATLSAEIKIKVRASSRSSSIASIASTSSENSSR
jgi:hypothetical protein